MYSMPQKYHLFVAFGIVMTVYTYITEGAGIVHNMNYSLKYKMLQRPGNKASYHLTAPVSDPECPARFQRCPHRIQSTVWHSDGRSDEGLRHPASCR